MCGDAAQRADAAAKECLARTRSRPQYLCGSEPVLGELFVAERERWKQHRIDHVEHEAEESVRADDRTGQRAQLGNERVVHVGEQIFELARATSGLLQALDDCAAV